MRILIPYKISIQLQPHEANCLIFYLSGMLFLSTTCSASVLAIPLVVFWLSVTLPLGPNPKPLIDSALTLAKPLRKEVLWWSLDGCNKHIPDGVSLNGND